MKGGSSHNWRIKKLSVTIGGLFCLTLAIWVWEKAPVLTTFVPSSDDIVTRFSIPSPEESPKTEYTHQQSSDVDVSPNPSTREVSSQSPSEGKLLGTNKVDGEGRSGRVKDTAKSKQGVGIRTVVDNAKGSSEQAKEEVNSEMITSEKKDCNYAKGKWVADSRRPLYSGFGCKQWLAGPWSCRLSKREDFSFENYRWQPQGCEMPKFEGSNFLKRMQHRTIAIVGDSLGRQQFQSLMCMVTGGREYSEVEDVGGQYGLALRPGAQRPDGWAYRFLQTNTTILYYWSASLCELEPINRTDPATDYAMHLDRPATYIKQYLSKFHVLVLNTGHHWNREKLTANKWVMYANGVPVTNRKLRQIYNAKNLTIYSLVKWLDSQLPQYPRLKVFFRTLSPRHFVNGEWNSGGSCDSTTPLSGGGEVTNDGSADPAVEAAVKGTRVELLDITGLSQLRDEGHISKYKSLKGAYDCLHWCLPGIPDTWNEILAARV